MSGQATEKSFQGEKHDLLKSILDLFMDADPEFTALTVADFIAQMMWYEMGSDTREYVEGRLNAALDDSRRFPQGVHRRDEAAQ
jgi:hypothetical protein